MTTPSKDISFYSPSNHGFIRCAVCVPQGKVAHPDHNTDQIITLAREASEKKAALTLFPEMAISGYSCEDLFHQEPLLQGSLRGLQTVLEESQKLESVLIVGSPIRSEGKLFNCAVVINQGQILGVVPKTYLPNYREFYEKRQFASALHSTENTLKLLGQTVPFGNNLIFRDEHTEHFSFCVEICEDLWAPVPPSTFGALAGASIIANCSASNITMGKADFRRSLCASQSGRCLSAYLYSAAGHGESTTDLAWDGYALIYENSEMLAESSRFATQNQMIISDIDGKRLLQDRTRSTTFADATLEFSTDIQRICSVPFSFTPSQEQMDLQRPVQRFPYVPHETGSRDQRCYEVFNIQVQGLVQRMEAAQIDKLIIGVSGGLDSTHALLVASQAMKQRGLSQENILACTMPGFATSDHTLKNAKELITSIKASYLEIDIKPSCEQMLKDIDHPYAKGEPCYDITFENVQAGDRTSHLFRLANLHQGLVLGTGDLSELALGWCTYGVGDQMSHYNVNSSVPKTLIQYLIRWVAETSYKGTPIEDILLSIVATEISPELVPGDNNDQEAPAQSTEEMIGPLELHDFFLYHITRFGFTPEKVAYLCLQAWQDKKKGVWPAFLPDNKKTQYDLKTIKQWLKVFLHRFFQTSQFKRSAMPNGPKVGSGGSLSPRGDWRAPSDAQADLWLACLENIPDE